MQILIPINSFTSFFNRDEFYFPKPLIEISGLPMIKHLIDSYVKIFGDNLRFIFVCEGYVLDEFSLDSTLQLLSKDKCTIIRKNKETSGALCSCLLAIDNLDQGKELIISNFDQIIDEDINKMIDFFRYAKADAGVLTFESVHPRWSYIYPSFNNTVEQVAEKKVISKHAIAGLYYFEKAELFVNTAKQAIVEDNSHDGKYFLSATLNQAILSGKKVMYQPISRNSYHSFYSPSKISEYELLYASKNASDSLNSLDTHVQVVIPAAGQGSRFSKAGWKKPKPFIDINGRPMLDHVISNVMPKQNASCSLILRSEHKDTYSLQINQISDHNNIEVSYIDCLTEGTVCTVLQVSEKFIKTSLLIANSDQWVDFDVNEFIKDAISRNLDGSILVFDEPSLDPKWSYVSLDENELVSEVAEKKPISNLATVGIYYFKSGQNFVNAASLMMAKNERVNNEFYTCPVYNYMIKSGLKIGIFKVQKDEMWGLGTPDDLNRYILENNLPCSQDTP